MAAPVSRGVGLVVRKAPTFTKVIVVKGTWKEKPSSELEKLQDGNSETRLWEFVDPGIDAQAEWVVKTGQTPPTKGDVVTASYSEESTTKKFVIVELENDRTGRKLKQTVSLEQRDAADSDLTET